MKRKNGNIYIKFIGLTQEQLDKLIEDIDKDIELNNNIFQKANNKKGDKRFQQFGISRCWIETK